HRLPASWLAPKNGQRAGAGCPWRRPGPPSLPKTLWIWDLGFGIWDLGFGIWDLGMRYARRRFQTATPARLAPSISTTLEGSGTAVPPVSSAKSSPPAPAPFSAS